MPFENKIESIESDKNEKKISGYFSTEENINEDGISKKESFSI